MCYLNAVTASIAKECVGISPRCKPVSIHLNSLYVEELSFTHESFNNLMGLGQCWHCGSDGVVRFSIWPDSCDKKACFLSLCSDAPVLCHLLSQEIFVTCPGALTAPLAYKLGTPSHKMHWSHQLLLLKQ